MYDTNLFETDIYNKLIGSFKVNPDKNNEKYFSILMPHPNVTGILHLETCTDLYTTIHISLVRYNRQKGNDTYWQPGLDYAGIVTQSAVEKWLTEQGIDYKI